MLHVEELEVIVKSPTGMFVWGPCIVLHLITLDPAVNEAHVND